MTLPKYKDWLVVLFLALISLLFFYKLGNRSLISWDEAWYADIARNIIKTGDLLNLTWNGKNFLDHPPFGFWLIAASFKVFGISDFWARFPSAIFGFLTLVFVYFLGKNLFNRKVGLLSSIALVSSYWFAYRARSADLDVFLTCLFVSSLYFFIKLSENKKYFFPSLLSLVFLFLTKTLIPFAILPALVFIIITSERKSRKRLILSLGLSLFIFGLWFYYNFLVNKNFISRFISIGAPGVKLHTDYLANIKLLKTYTYEGIGKWFWPSAISIIFSLFLFQKRFFILTIFILSFTLPFIFSMRGNIWHLIPLHPFMLISMVGFSYVILKKLIKNELIIISVLFIGVLYNSFIQTRRNWYEFINTTTYVSDEAILSKEAGKFDLPFYIDSDFGPAAAFYSGRNVQQFSDPSLRGLFDKEQKFSLITFQWRIDSSKIKKDEYKIIKSDRDKILIVRQ